jgi:hypothetical protein
MVSGRPRTAVDGAPVPPLRVFHHCLGVDDDVDVIADDDAPRSSAAFQLTPKAWRSTLAMATNPARV